MLSTLSGDKSAWLVYLSIGNLGKEIRRSTKSNGLILIGLLPKVPRKPREHTTKRAFHMALREILRPLEAPARDGVEMRCADGHTRVVFPRISSFLADYPEQCLLTLVKQGWCPRCELRPAEFPGYNRRPIRRSPGRCSDMSEDMAASLGYWKFPDFAPFSDCHEGCDIFSCIGVDRLHQLLKGVFHDHAWKWVIKMLESIHGVGKAAELVDKRFAEVPHFTDLRNFGHKFSGIQQWTGAEFKDMLKVWLAVLAPLLKGYPDHMRFLKAVTDFILIAGYYSHSDSTLGYLQDALNAISRGLPHFSDFRKSDDASGIPKLHAIFHYVECIREMGSADNTDTEQTESAHRWLIKDGYRASNKVDYVPQILEWERRLFHIKNRVNLYRYLIAHHRSSQHAPTCQLLVEPLSIPPEIAPPRLSRLEKRRVLLASLTRHSRFTLSELLGALVNHWRGLPQSIHTSPELQSFGGQRTWVLRQRICVAAGITITVPKHNQPRGVAMQRARCTFNWRKSERERFDYILVQGPREDGRSLLRQEGLRVARLVFAFRFVDKINTGPLTNDGIPERKLVCHDLLLVEDMEYLDSAMPNDCHGMVTCRESSPSRRRLRIVPACDAWLAVHLVPSGRGGKYFLNQYTSLEAYNQVY